MLPLVFAVFKRYAVYSMHYALSSPDTVDPLKPPTAQPLALERQHGAISGVCAQTALPDVRAIELVAAFERSQAEEEHPIEAAASVQRSPRRRRSHRLPSGWLPHA